MVEHMKKYAYRKKGAALSYAIIAVLILSVFSVSITFIVLRNVNQSKLQEKNLQAYYIAMSATDLCLAALIQEGSGGENDTLLYAMFRPEVSNPATLTDNISLGDGVVNLTVSAVTKNGERWIEIIAVATLIETGQTHTTNLQFKYSEPRVQILD